MKPPETEQRCNESYLISYIYATGQAPKSCRLPHLEHFLACTTVDVLLHCPVPLPVVFFSIGLNWLHFTSVALAPGGLHVDGLSLASDADVFLC